MSMKEEHDHAPLPNCAFLAFRTFSDDHVNGAFEQIICEAGGGFVLGTTKSIRAAQKVCLSCDIPQSLKRESACLHLVPFRVFQENHVQSYYGCRWYFSLNPQKAPKNTDWCRGCSAWFPRPVEALITDQTMMSRKLLQIFLNPSETIDPSFHHLGEGKRKWHERLRDLFNW